MIIYKAGGGSVCNFVAFGRVDCRRPPPPRGCQPAEEEPLRSYCKDIMNDMVQYYARLGRPAAEVFNLL
jgi:hypothetical protein